MFIAAWYFSCGNNKTISTNENFLPDYRLYDIWVLEIMNDHVINRSDFGIQFPYIEINTAEATIMGNTSCNEFNGKLVANQNTLRFIALEIAKKPCKEHKKVAEFLKLLQNTTLSYKIENNKLYLHHKKGKDLIFKKID